MVKTLVKHGNSWALIIDKPILDLLKVDPCKPMDVSTNGDALILRPIRDGAKVDAEFDALARDLVTRYDKTLKILSE